MISRGKRIELKKVFFLCLREEKKKIKQKASLKEKEKRYNITLIGLTTMKEKTTKHYLCTICPPFGGEKGT